MALISRMSNDDAQNKNNQICQLNDDANNEAKTEEWNRFSTKKILIVDEGEWRRLCFLADSIIQVRIYYRARKWFSKTEENKWFAR